MTARVAVVHEWVAARTGSEKVFEALARMHPHADLWALSVDPAVGLDTGGRPIRTTWLDHPQLRARRGVTLPLMPRAWSALTGDYDVVISSHHAFAHAVGFGRAATHLSYVHSPARYVWSPELDGRGASALLAPARVSLRRLDLRASRHVDSYAANSTAVATRIQDCWDRDAVVIAPPVDTGFYTPAVAATRPADRGYLLGASRWIPYKRLELVIELGDRTGMPVVIAGGGPQEASLRARAERASVPVAFVHQPDDQSLRELYRGARALVFPAVEDFGIMPVEAMACGTPVIGPAMGGLLDTVAEGRSGALAPTVAVDDLATALERTVDTSVASCRARALAFSPEAFERAVLGWTAGALGHVPAMSA
jgi:glycosyltransferase involved in cell wall biosynthesis